MPYMTTRERGMLEIGSHKDGGALLIVHSVPGPDFQVTSLRLSYPEVLMLERVCKQWREGLKGFWDVVDAGQMAAPPGKVRPDFREPTPDEIRDGKVAR